MKGLMSNCCWERKVQGTKVPRNERSREQMFPIGTFCSWEQKVLSSVVTVSKFFLSVGFSRFWRKTSVFGSVFMINTL